MRLLRPVGAARARRTRPRRPPGAGRRAAPLLRRLGYVSTAPAAASVCCPTCGEPVERKGMTHYYCAAGHRSSEHLQTGRLVPDPPTTPGTARPAAPDARTNGHRVARQPAPAPASPRGMAPVARPAAPPIPHAALLSAEIAELRA